MLLHGGGVYPTEAYTLNTYRCCMSPAFAGEGFFTTMR